MKKTLNINLGGIAFIIDENAYEILHSYFESLRMRFSNEQERDEILQDIEARVAELLEQSMASRKMVVNIEDVEKVIQTLGRPEDIAGEETTETVYEPTKDQSSQQKPTSGKVAKRLFRDPDDKRVGGVIAGLCHYFGINDPTWARLAVVLLCFVSFGTVLLMYFLLLIVIPEAKTAAEKLQMKGEPVNISTIEKEVKEAAMRAGDSLQNMVGNQTFLQKLVHLFATVVKGMLKIALFLILALGFFIILIVGASLFGVYVIGSALMPDIGNIVVESPAMFSVFKVGLFLVIVMPVVAIIYGALRLLLGQKPQVKWLKWSLLGAWLIGILLTGITTVDTLRSYSTPAVQKQTITLMQPANANLFVQLADSTDNTWRRADKNNDQDVHEDEMIVIVNNRIFSTPYGYNIGQPSLQLMPSYNDSFVVEQIITTQGRNRENAQKNISYIRYVFSQQDSTLNLAPYFELSKEGKWRNQQVKLRIGVPQNATIHFADNIDRWAVTVKGDSYYDDTYFANTIWTNEQGKIKCLVGENHDNFTEPQEEEPVKKESNKQQDKGDENSGFEDF